ncbi:MAG: hypothetical protein JNJ54_24760 [Myxococcaceae bacterium]|nr:hypothetical protein [Myxococcaceae bacterium]
MRAVVLLIVGLALSCNPAPRCRTSGDCGGGVCSGGFCTDVTGPVGGGAVSTADGGNRLETTDLDDADASVADAGVRADAGQETNGRP